MNTPLGLSIGSTNLVSARVGEQPVIRRSALQRPDGSVLTGFVERIGDPIPLAAADGSAHPADRLLTDALALMAGPQPPAGLAVAVPAHWSPSMRWALRAAVRDHPVLGAGGQPRLVSDATAALTALNANPGFASRGVVAMLDFGGTGTSLTLADAGAAFEPVDATVRHADFSGAQLDSALLTRVLDGLGGDGVDPAGTVAVGALARLRDDVRRARERLSVDTATALAVELPGHRTEVRLTRGDVEALAEAPLAGALAAMDDLLDRNRLAWADLAAVVAIGGLASMPFVVQRLSQHARKPVVVSPAPALDPAIGAALFAAYGPEADAPTTAAPTVGVALPPGPPADPAAPGSATFRALAWSQEQPRDDDVMPFVADFDPDEVPEPAPVFDAEPVDAGLWRRLPLMVFVATAVAVVVALGGVTYALTSATESTPTETPTAPPPPPPVTEEPPPPPVVEEPPPLPPVVEEPAPPPVVTVTQAPPPPPETTTITVTPTTTEPTTTEPTTTTTTTAPTTTTTTTQPPQTTTTIWPSPTTVTPTPVPPSTTQRLRTTHISVPLLPPIPVVVPEP